MLTKPVIKGYVINKLNTIIKASKTLPYPRIFFLSLLVLIWFLIQISPFNILFFNLSHYIKSINYYKLFMFGNILDFLILTKIKHSEENNI